MTITHAVITEYQGTHQIKVFEPADNITDLDMTGCHPVEYNWDFEDWTDSDPPVNFVETSGGDVMTVLQETTDVHGGTSAARMTINSGDGTPELAQAWYMPLDGATTATFSVWLVDNDPNVKARLVFKFYDGTQEVADDNSKYSGYSSDSADWAQMTVTRDVPAEATEARAFVRLYDENDFATAGTATVVIDDWNVAL